MAIRSGIYIHIFLKNILVLDEYGQKLYASAFELYALLTDKMAEL